MVATELPPPNFYFWQVKAGSKSPGICQIAQTLVLTAFYQLQNESKFIY
ncbi:hypothetical protein [Anabaena sp. CCY 9402-a]